MGPAITLAGGVLGSVGGVLQAFEFQNQVNYERNVLTNNSAMILASRDSSVRDITNRATIMSSRAYAMAGKAGVTATGSVVNAAADIIAKAEVDKLRVNVMANNQVALNKFRASELKRQATTKMVGAGVNAFVTTGAQLFTSGL